MKNKSINMEKEKFPRLLISIFTLMLVPFLNIYAQTTPFFVMSLQDKEQFVYKWNQFDNWSNSTTITNSQASIKSMIEIDGIKFYNGYCAGHKLILGWMKLIINYTICEAVQNI
ncbi:MAG: hypothetical protein IPJ75_17415 [Ignavibacteriales bacterium]|nr:hypothetical protein [Ignavibacteriales bacterium]